MPVALKPGGSREYVLREERKSDAPTVFLLRNLTVAEREEAMNLLGEGLEQMQEGELKLKLANFLTVCRLGLAGWRNFPQADGTELRFETVEWQSPSGVKLRAVDPALLDFFEINHLVELANAILKQSQLTEDDEGNSQESA